MRSLVKLVWVSIFLFPTAIMADSGPTEFYIPGNVGGRTVTEVAMVKEIVTFKKFTDDLRRVLVRAEFWFENQGEKDEVVPAFFPVLQPLGYFVDDQEVTDEDKKEVLGYMSPGEADIRIDGTKLETKVDLLNLSPQLKRNNDWWIVELFELPVEKGKTVHLVIDYEINEDWYSWGGRHIFKYLLRTGEGWRGSIGQGDIVVNSPVAPNEYSIQIEGPKAGTISVDGNTLTMHFEKLEPESGDDITVTVVEKETTDAIFQKKKDAEAHPDRAWLWFQLGEMVYDATWSSFYSIPFYERAISALPFNVSPEERKTFINLYDDYRDLQPRKDGYFGAIWDNYQLFLKIRYGMSDPFCKYTRMDTEFEGLYQLSRFENDTEAEDLGAYRLCIDERMLASDEPSNQKNIVETCGTPARDACKSSLNAEFYGIFSEHEKNATYEKAVKYLVPLPGTLSTPVTPEVKQELRRTVADVWGLLDDGMEQDAIRCFWRWMGMLVQGEVERRRNDAQYPAVGMVTREIYYEDYLAFENGVCHNGQVISTSKARCSNNEKFCPPLVETPGEVYWRCVDNQCVPAWLESFGMTVQRVCIEQRVIH